MVILIERLVLATEKEFEQNRHHTMGEVASPRDTFVHEVFLLEWMVVIWSYQNELVFHPEVKIVKIEEIIIINRLKHLNNQNSPLMASATIKHEINEIINIITSKTENTKCQNYQKC